MSDAFSKLAIGAIDAKELTPAMRQYQTYKAQYADAILFFRIGDFYETFYEDARVAARVLGVALTSRSKGENAVPMAGVPYHAVESYLQRMIAAGYKVAICEQVEDARQAKGLIDRQVTRLVTPGTLTDEALLDGREENFLACAVPVRSEQSTSAGDADMRPGEPLAMAWCELSTGKFNTMAGTFQECIEELARVRPRELIFAERADHQSPAWAMQIKEMNKLTLTPRAGWQLETHHASQTLRQHYGVLGFEAFGYEVNSPEIRAAGGLLAYLHETQKSNLEHLRPPGRFDRGQFMVIDPVSLRSLEVLRTLRSNTTDGSLAASLDQTKTAMGSRLLRHWLVFPLRDVGQINERLCAVAELLDNLTVLEEVRTLLTDCADIERITARICCRRASPRDLAALGRSLDILPMVDKLLQRANLSGGSWDAIRRPLGQTREIADHIRNAVVEAPPAHLRDGGVIRDGFHPELDRLRQLTNNSRGWLADYQAELIKQTGIPSLKVGYNKVFGFYIELTQSNQSKAPAEFIRRQTVKNAERYITPKLKEFESETLTAQEKSRILEGDIFESLRTELAAAVTVLQRAGQALASLDTLCSIAFISWKRQYCRPQMTSDRELKIREGWHPVVGNLLGDKFVPNDLNMISGQSTLHLITGPNMAGKSTFIRQAALIVLMAQAGFFVPAKEAVIGLVDRIFTRVGASDDLAAGNSTFMIEMVETANILLHATAQSLVILDEIGRGTSTLDGLALAWAITEHLAETIGCRTLFATHYHEITDLAQTLPAVSNYSVLVREWEDQIVFMHRIIPGAADRSYGVQVARLAGLPRSVVQRARKLTDQLAVQVGKIRPRAAATQVSGQINLFATAQEQVLEQLMALDINRMSPMQTWEAIKSLQALLTESKTKSASVARVEATAP